jgi:hypothetical protein
MKWGVLQSLYNTATNICHQEKYGLTKEMANLKWYLQFSNYPLHFSTSILNPAKDSSLSKNHEKPLVSVIILHTKGFSEKFKHIVNQYNIETIFGGGGGFRGSTMRNKPHRGPQHWSHYAQCIQRKCGRNNVGGIGRLLVVRCTEHKISNRDIWEN